MSLNPLDVRTIDHLKTKLSPAECLLLSWLVSNLMGETALADDIFLDQEYGRLEEEIKGYQTDLGKFHDLLGADFLSLEDADDRWDRIFDALCQVEPGQELWPANWELASADMDWAGPQILKPSNSGDLEKPVIAAPEPEPAISEPVSAEIAQTEEPPDPGPGRANFYDGVNSRGRVAEGGLYSERELIEEADQIDKYTTPRQSTCLRLLKDGHSRSKISKLMGVVDCVGFIDGLRAILHQGRLKGWEEVEREYQAKQAKKAARNGPPAPHEDTSKLIPELMEEKS